MSESLFYPGQVVQLRSGGPLLTVADARNAKAEVIYHNTVSGKFDSFTVPETCLREANQAPQVPSDANNLRSTSVAKSSL